MLKVPLRAPDSASHRARELNTRFPMRPEEVSEEGSDVDPSKAYVQKDPVRIDKHMKSVPVGRRNF